ncbi:hypothetical protein ASPZODRAFT_131370 [Penicilliopsis zonata CBS 506.65]|uniref:Cryptic loci regulator 2 N-terminal domain-containing protein n=1 Tax=Penicilliopsis zonata CBS 506.65 TaxID=1073090 RepID=A0A1L9SL02_9EURO|nr:hypothetical protein ASPZODRAFT_131370 [Penicilliopsis zonata CBS 506.65]OJJ47796.1 hypothetical protein ASPZODRAFT_131370 [Penicilliopsis zonata CBS 506.65]
MSDSEDPEKNGLITIPIDRAFSDGDKKIWPKHFDWEEAADDTRFREKLARLWLQKIGAFEEGVEYTVDQLPDGYVMIDRPRRANPEIRDRFLYGHPSGYYFDSCVKFFPHFYYLMTGGTSQCKCVLCTKMDKHKQYKAPSQKKTSTTSTTKTGVAAAAAAAAANNTTVVRRGPGRPWVRPIADVEGTPDVFRLAIKKLKERGTLDEPIEEPGSMDWRAERTPLGEYLEKLTLQPSYVPRAGELVLWIPSLDGELRWNFAKSRIQIFSRDEKKWLGDPEWCAGVITQTPEEAIVIHDLQHTTEKAWDLNYSGFRVETFPDPNSTDKSYSLHYKYIPLKCIKPFNSLELFCEDIEHAHPSIRHAMVVMSSFSLLDKYRFKGTWPNGSIYCRGIFLGAELLVVGDAVRLKPRGYDVDSEVLNDAVDVMVIDSIRLVLRNCAGDVTKAEQLAEQYSVRFQGKVYTRFPKRADNQASPLTPLTHDEIVNAFQYVGMGGYGAWYRTHSPEKSVEVSQDMIIGRCYEPDAMNLLFGTLSSEMDLHGVVSMREFSRQADARIPEGKHWFWGDYRAETLALHTLNGEDVSHYSDARDVKMWRATLKVIDGTATNADVRDAKIPQDVGRPPRETKPSLPFAEVRKISKLVNTGLATDLSTNVSSAEETNDDSESEVDFSIPLPVRGGTEETEMGDYIPDDEPEPKRPRL